MRGPLSLDTVIWSEAEDGFFFLTLKVQINFLREQKSYQDLLSPFAPYALE